jgi:hypothetical protein
MIPGQPYDDMMRRTFSAGCTPVQIIRQRLPLQYSMVLNREDMLSLFYALRTSSDDRCHNLAASILETLNIEEI